MVKDEAELKLKPRLKDLQDWLQCAWCEGWIKTEDLDPWNGHEAFDARGYCYRYRKQLNY